MGLIFRRETSNKVNQKCQKKSREKNYEHSEWIFLYQTWKEEYFEILETWEPLKPFHFLCSTLYHDKINKVPNQEYQQSSK